MASAAHWYCGIADKVALRPLRAPLLAQLDVEWFRAAEIADSVLKREIATKKQALRDAPADPVNSVAA